MNNSNVLTIIKHNRVKEKRFQKPKGRMKLDETSTQERNQDYKELTTFSETFSIAKNFVQLSVQRVFTFR